MSVRVSCPYCNTGFELSGVPAGGRAVCPRCGDAFKVHGPVEVAAAPAAAPTPPHPPRESKSGGVRPLLIALAFVAAGGGLLYFRGGFRQPDPVEPIRESAVAPPELRGLGYLPPDSNIVFAVQPGPVLAYAERTTQDPRVLLTQAGVPPAVLATLDRLGIPLQDIDHVAAGAHVPDTDLSQLRLAVALLLRRPLEEGRFLDQLKAKRVEQGGTTRYDVEVAGVPLKLAKATDRAWVFGWSEKDLEPAWAGGTTTQRPAGLREVIDRRVPADAAGWVATDSARWAEKKPVAALLQFAGWSKERLDTLAKGRAAAIGVTLGGQPRLHVAVQCADADTTDRLRAYFREQATGPAPAAGGDGDWATLDTAADPREWFTTLKRVLGDAVK